MALLIDTNIAIHLRDGDATVLARMATVTDAVVMSIVTRVELEGGVYRDPQNTTLRRQRLDVVLRAIPTLAFDDAAASIYATIVAHAGYSRRNFSIK